MKTLLVWLLMIGTAQAGTLSWDYNTATGLSVPPTATVQRSQTATGTFSDVATIPSLPSTYAEPPAPAGWASVHYRIANVAGVSNVVGYTIPAATTTTGPAGPAGPPGPQGAKGDTGATGATGAAGAPADMTRVQALEQRVTTLEQPAPAPEANLTVTIVSPDKVVITGDNCLTMKASGTGMQRSVTCGH